MLDYQGIDWLAHASGDVCLEARNGVDLSIQNIHGHAIYRFMQLISKLSSMAGANPQCFDLVEISFFSPRENFIQRLLKMLFGW